MKKKTLKSTIILACVPLLLGGASFVHAENITTSTSTSEVQSTESSTVNSSTNTSSTTTSSTTTDVPTSSTDKENTDYKLKVKALPKKIVTGDKGKLELENYEGIKLQGDFIVNEKENKNGVIKLDEKGNWVALKDGKTNFNKLQFSPDKETKKKLEAKFKDEDFSKPLNVDQVKFNVTKKDKKETAELTLSVKSPDVKDNKGKLITSVGSDELKAAYTPIKNETIDLKADGSFTIPETNKKAKFTQKVSLELNKDDANFKKIATSEAYKEKNIQTKYDNLEVNITQTTIKKVNLTYTVKELTSNIAEKDRKLAFENYEGVTISGTFTEIKNDEFFSLASDGTWTAKKAGEGSIDPTFIPSKETLESLQKKYPEQKIEINTNPIKVNFASASGGGSNQKQYAPVAKKQYAPVSKLPQTGEEKMRFAGVIGLIILVIVGLIFFLKRKKNDDNDDEI